MLQTQPCQPDLSEPDFGKPGAVHDPNQNSHVCGAWKGGTLEVTYTQDTGSRSYDHRFETSS